MNRSEKKASIALLALYFLYKSVFERQRLGTGRGKEKNRRNEYKE
jgi:hypothetical protein